MSWYSDNEKFNEYDPPYCKDCKKDATYATCKACQKLHEDPEQEEKVEITPELREELYDMLDMWSEYDWRQYKLIDMLVEDYYLTDDQAESILSDWYLERMSDPDNEEI